MERRDFLKSALAGGVSAGRCAGAQSPLARRRYKDDVELSLIGLGGIVLMGLPQNEANRMVAQAYERGVNYYDVAPSYGNGEAQEKLGPALEPYRDKVFLACKTRKFDAAGARSELDQSLKTLRTGHFDLYQFHGVTTRKEVEQILGPGGAAETFRRAREEGKVRYLGCSAHSVEAALAMIDGFPLDSILFPINFVCFAQGNFGPQVIRRAKEKGVARLALKALAYTPWPKGTNRRATGHPKAWYRPVDDPKLARQALRFTLSEDITAAVPPGDEGIFSMALQIASEFQPLTQSEREQLLASTAGLEPLFKA